MRPTQGNYMKKIVNQLKFVNSTGNTSNAKRWNQMTPSLVLRKVHSMNSENSMQKQINTPPKT